MKKVIFDFDYLADLPAFYREFAQQFDLGTEFGANLDALWDAVTADIHLPVAIEFTHLSQRRRKRRFGAVVLLFKEAEKELMGSLRFTLQ